MRGGITDKLGPASRGLSLKILPIFILKVPERYSLTADWEKMGKASNAISLEVTAIPKGITGWVEPVTQEWDREIF